MKVKKIAALAVAGALCVGALSGCSSVDKNETIATLGDHEIKAGVVNFLCRFQQSNYQDYYVSALGDDAWNSDPYSSGTTMQESLKSSIMESVREMYTDYYHMDDYGISLTDEEKDKISEVAAQFMSDNDKDTLKEMTATQEIVEEVLTLYTVREKMYDAIIADVDTNVTDEEANMRAYTMLRVGISGSYDSSYNYTAYTDDEIAEIESGVQSLADSITDPSQFEELAEEAGYSTTTSTYDADDELDDALREALDGLEEGEISGMVTGESYVYIVRIDSDTDEEATEENRESILETRKDDLYDSVLEGWEEEDEWTIDDDVLAKIQFTNAISQETESTEDTEEATEEVIETESTEASEDAESTEAVSETEGTETADTTEE